jgi:hypothetical protein
MPNGTIRARLVTPAAEPLSLDRTIAIVNEERKGKSADPARCHQQLRVMVQVSKDLH